MTSSILIIHTASQLEQVSNLVDLLEASLSLGDGAVACSSLPGYGWTDGDAPTIPFSSAIAAIALIDDHALRDPQLLCDVGAVWSTGKRVAVIVEHPELRRQLPVQLRQGQVIDRGDRGGLAALVEDIAFDLGVDPRIGREANRLIEQISVAPPAPSKPVEVRSERPVAGGSVSKKPPAASVAPRAGGVAAHDEPIPPPARASSRAGVPKRDPEPEATARAAASDPPPEGSPVVRPSQPASRLRCEVALEAGYAIGECSFHRDDAALLGGDLGSTFGRFIDAIGGRFEDLQRLADVELWLGATDNLLEALPASARVIAEWYEIGFQYATLKCIAEQGLPEAIDERAVYEEMWERSLTQLKESAKVAGLPMHEVRRVQALLENVIGPETYRDYGNLGASVRELRELAKNADRPANRYARLAN